MKRVTGEDQLESEEESEEEEDEEEEEEERMPSKIAQQPLESLDGSVNSRVRKWDPILKCWLDETQMEGEFWRDH